MRVAGKVVVEGNVFLKDNHQILNRYGGNRARAGQRAEHNEQEPAQAERHDLDLTKISYLYESVLPYVCYTIWPWLFVAGWNKLPGRLSQDPIAI